MLKKFQIIKIKAIRNISASTKTRECLIEILNESRLRSEYMRNARATTEIDTNR
jgi:hypothetical protein